MGKRDQHDQHDMVTTARIQRVSMWSSAGHGVPLSYPLTSHCKSWHRPGEERGTPSHVDTKSSSTKREKLALRATTKPMGMAMADFYKEMVDTYVLDAVLVPQSLPGSRQDGVCVGGGGEEPLAGHQVTADQRKHTRGARVWATALTDWRPRCSSVWGSRKPSSGWGCSSQSGAIAGSHGKKGW